jgi:hypothetical protein
LEADTLDIPNDILLRITAQRPEIELTSAVTSWVPTAPAEPRISLSVFFLGSSLVLNPNLDSTRVTRRRNFDRKLQAESERWVRLCRSLLWRRSVLIELYRTVDGVVARAATTNTSQY